MLLNLSGTVYVKRHRGTGYWVADYRLSSAGQLLTEAFGSTTFILTHTVGTPFVSVALSIKVRHPGVLVHHEHDNGQ